MVASVHTCGWLLLFAFTSQEYLVVVEEMEDPSSYPPNF